jgi:hypothetical protein
LSQPFEAYTWPNAWTVSVKSESTYNWETEKWSVTGYNADGCLEANDLGVNNYNNFSAKPNEDGSCTIHFCGCGNDRVNCIPVSPGWNCAIRRYEPREAILDGSWTLPSIEPLK